MAKGQKSDDCAKTSKTGGEGEEEADAVIVNKKHLKKIKVLIVRGNKLKRHGGGNIS